MCLRDRKIVVTPEDCAKDDWHNRKDFRPFRDAPRAVIWDGVAEKLHEITSRPIGWDGYGSGPARPDAAYFAAFLLGMVFEKGIPAPQIEYGGGGTVMMTWQKRHRIFGDAELEVKVFGAWFFSVDWNFFPQGRCPSFEPRYNARDLWELLREFKSP